VLLNTVLFVISGVPEFSKEPEGTMSVKSGEFAGYVNPEGNRVSGSVEKEGFPYVSPVPSQLESAGFVYQ
jgi:hypothetical protein